MCVDAFLAICEIFIFRSSKGGGGHGPMVNTPMAVHKLTYLVPPPKWPRLCRVAR